MKKFMKIEIKKQMTFYYLREYKANKFVNERLVGKQLKRAENSAKRTLLNLLIDRIDIISYLDGGNYTVLKSFNRE